MAALNKSITETLHAHHPTLDPKTLKEGNNTIDHDNGTTFMAKIKNGKLTELTALGKDGPSKGSLVSIEPPVAPQPDHILVCWCDPDEGDGCWWVPRPGEGGGIHRAS